MLIVNFLRNQPRKLFADGNMLLGKVVFPEEAKT